MPTDSEIIARSYTAHPATRLLKWLRTSSGPLAWSINVAAAVFSAAQVTLAWMCLPYAILCRLLRTTPKLSGAKSSRLLVVSMGGIGDNILLIPFLRSLRAVYPNHEITFVLRPISCGFSALLPDCVDKEIPYWFSTTPVGRLLEPIQALRFTLQNQLFNVDEVVVPRWDTDVCGASFVAFFSSAASRISFSESVNAEKRSRNWLYDTLYTSVYLASKEMHERDKLASLFAQHYGSQVHADTSLIHRDTPPRQNPVERIVFAPFTGHPRKNWSPDNWKRVLAHFAARPFCPELVIVGGPQDQSAGEAIAAVHPKVRMLCGLLSYPELVALFLDSNVCVGGDTGVLHLAGASGIPIVVLFCHPRGGSPWHLNSPLRFAPPSDRITTLQPTSNSGCEAACEAFSPCCINNIAVEDVTAAIELQLESSYARSDSRYAVRGV